jgi:hypothetical protein
MPGIMNKGRSRVCLPATHRSPQWDRGNGQKGRRWETIPRSLQRKKGSSESGKGRTGAASSSRHDGTRPQTFEMASLKLSADRSSLLASSSTKPEESRLSSVYSPLPSCCVRDSTLEVSSVWRDEEVPALEDGPNGSTRMTI